ncbi:Alanine racemase TOXG [Madurella mycetomatis]|uniref:Alanine racemase TOXG n=1 Tax=Madurella mycetomatis TaxID=100816 RepID=A0A175VS89_9PEZI|nr:Alanine racemase TOXG [Madurella mycetomatis]
MAADAITTPSIRQLAAISRATLNDDVFGEDSTTSQFEREMADACGQEAGAFVMSGTMANQLALGALCQHRPHAVLADASAHVVNFEAGGLAHLSGATVQPVQPSNGLYLTVDDIARHAKVPSPLATDKGSSSSSTTKSSNTWTPLPWEVCPTKIVSLENTAHGNIIPLAELRAIKEWASRRGVLVHVDGARIWDAVASGRAGTLAEMASCTDAMTLSFAKGVGAPIGAMVVGSAEVIERVKRLRQSVGGGVRKVGVLAAAAREAVLENFGPGPADTRGAFGTAHDMAGTAARWWTDRGGKLIRPTETNMVWLDLAAAGVTAEALNYRAMRSGILLAAPRIVFHHQICAKAMASLEQLFDDVLVRRRAEAAVGPGGGVGMQSKGCVQPMWQLRGPGGSGDLCGSAAKPGATVDP